MKPTICLALAALAALSLAACGAPADSSPAASSSSSSSSVSSAVSSPEPASSSASSQSASLVNPVTSYTSTDDLNAIVGCELYQLPVMGVSDNCYSVIDTGDYKLAEYSFRFMEYDWVYRAAPTRADISGVCHNGQTLGELGQPGTVFAAGNFRYVRWFRGDMQYSLYASGADAPGEDLFDTAYSELYGLQSASPSASEMR